ncbi:MAG: aminoacyl-tRNA hydrolase [Acidobacteria bacterium]|nr:MAG: aminoacyl-tRNA hydrolase [Acidobacteriota bacterium]
MDRIAVADGVTVPGSALSFRAVRASGPGGQNVNKVASKVELRVDLALVEGLSPAARERLQALAGSRLDADGRLLVVSQRTRDQHRNLEDAREKVRHILGRALRRPRPRRATTPSTAAREDRLREKKKRAARKRARAGAGHDED